MGMHKVTVDNYPKEILGWDRDTFEAGEKVQFRIPRATDTSYYVSSDQVHVCQDSEAGYSELRYYFYMPDCDVEVNVRTKSTMMNVHLGPFLMGSMADIMDKNTPPQTMQQSSEIDPFQWEGKPKFCSECGSSTKGADRFCLNCGYPLKKME